MDLPVYIPLWCMADGGIPPLAVGGTLSHVLAFESKTGDPGAHYGCFGRETTVTGTAHPLTGHEGGRAGAFPTALRCFSYMLYWEAPSYIEGSVMVSGIVSATDHGAAPAGFPRAFGRINSLSITALLYESTDAGGQQWVPAPGRHPTFEAVASYPPAFPPLPEEDSGSSPQMKATGVVVELDTLYKEEQPQPPVRPATPVEAEAATVRLRLFPDFAGTVLWLFGPVDYGAVPISAELVAELADWDSSYSTGLDSGLAWRSADLETAFNATGSLLAQRLADELGDGFEVEFRNPGTDSRHAIFRSHAPAGNPAAADAINKLAAAQAQQQARNKAFAGRSPGWFAYAPLSGTIFAPGASTEEPRRH